MKKQTCAKGCLDRHPYFCQCNMKINHPINPATIADEVKLGNELKQGHTERRIGKTKKK